MIKNDPRDFKINDGKLDGFYRGVVEDNDDPLKAGRCKIRIWGIHTHIKESTPTHGVPIEHLAWAEPILPLIEGGVSWYGLWSIPLKGSWVIVFFENGNIMKPLYFGCLPGIPAEGPQGVGGTIEGGFWDPEELHPENPCPYDGPSAGISKLLEPDLPRFLRGETGATYIPKVDEVRIKGIETTVEQTSGPVWDEEVPFYMLGVSEYKHMMALMTHGQMSMEFDNTPRNTRFSLVHWISLSRFEIWEDGKMILKNRGGHRYDLVEKGDRREWTEFDHLQTCLQTKYIRCFENHYLHANMSIHEKADEHIWQTADEWIWDEAKTYHKTTALEYIIETAGTYNHTITEENEIYEESADYIKQLANTYIHDEAGSYGLYKAANDITVDAGEDLNLNAGGNITLDAGGYIKFIASSLIYDISGNSSMTGSGDFILNITNLNVIASGSISLNGAVAITGSLTLNGQAFTFGNNDW